MQLSQADKDTIVAWLQQKCGPMRCFCCGEGKWEVIDIAVMPVGVDVRTTRVHYHVGLHEVGVVCTNCGHLVFFSPAIMGIRPNPPEVHVVPRESDVGGQPGVEDAQQQHPAEANS